MKKNTATKWVVFAFTTADNLPKTGDAAQITGSVRIDGGADNPIDDTNPAELAGGYYVFDITAAECNGDNVVIIPASSTAGVQVIGVPGAVWTNASVAQTGDNYARLGAPAGASVSADVAAVKSDSGAIKTKTDFLPSATAGAAGGVFIAGSNAATSITTALTANITGNVSGSVGSVTGAVGSVTGNVGGNVVGSVASVTARVTANADQLAGQTITAAAGVTFPTSVASPTNITAGVITTTTNLTNLPAVPADWLTAAGVKADAVTKIQAGLATSTEIATLPTDVQNAAAVLAAAVVDPIEANIKQVNDVTIQGTGAVGTDEWRKV